MEEEKKSVVERWCEPKMTKRIYVVTHMSVDNENCFYHSSVEYLGSNREKAYDILDSLYRAGVKEFERWFNEETGYTDDNACVCGYSDVDGTVTAEVEAGGNGMNYFAEKFWLDYADIDEE